MITVSNRGEGGCLGTPKVIIITKCNLCTTPESLNQVTTVSPGNCPSQTCLHRLRRLLGEGYIVHIAHSFPVLHLYMSF